MRYGYGQGNNLLSAFGGSASIFGGIAPSLSLGQNPNILAASIPPAYLAGDIIEVTASGASPAVLQYTVTTGDQAAQYAVIPGLDQLSGVNTVTARMKRGGDYGVSSKPVRLGDAVAPVLASTAATVDEYATSAATLTFDKPVWCWLTGPESYRMAIKGAQPGSAFTVERLDGAMIRYGQADHFDRSTLNVLNFVINAEGTNGVAMTPASRQVTVNQLAAPYFTPLSTPVQDAVENQPYTLSQTFNFGVSGIDFATTFTGSAGATAKKNGSPVSGTFNLRNGDTVERTVTGPAANASAYGQFTVGGVDHRWSVNGTFTLPLEASLKGCIEPARTANLFQLLNGTTAVAADGDPVGFVDDFSAGNFNWAATANTGIRPTWKAGGGVPYIEFDGIDDRLLVSSLLGLYGQNWTMMVAVKAIDASTYRAVIAEGNSASDNATFNPFGMSNDSNGNASPFVRNDAGGQILGTNTTLKTGVWDDVGKIVTIKHTAGSNFATRVGIGSDTTLNYTPTGVFTLNRTAIGATARSTPSSFAPFRLYGFWFWPGVLLDNTQQAQAANYASVKALGQGTL